MRYRFAPPSVMKRALVSSTRKGLALAARRILTLCACAALAACGEPSPETSSEAAQPTPQAAPSGEVAAADEFGPFSQPVNDIAFWTHPRLTFEGLVLTANASGVRAFNIEDGAQVSQVEDIAAHGLEVLFVGAGPEARGIVVAGGADELRFYEISNETRALTALPAAGATIDADVFCAGLARDGAPRLVAIKKRDVATYRLNLRASDIRLQPSVSTQTPEDIAACVADPLDGRIFLAGRSGAVHEMSDDGEIKSAPFARLAGEDIRAIGLVLFGLVEGGPTEECCGAIAVLDASDASIRFIDRDDGRMMGVVRVKASYDVEGVATATAMGLTYGNFGGVYRDGVLALAANGDNPVLRLAPLNGVMDAIDAPLGPTAEPRALADQDEDDDGLIIDVDLVKE